MGKENEVSDEKKAEGATPETPKTEPEISAEAKKAANAEDAMRRMGEERDKARKELESMKAKLAKDAEEKRLATMDEVARAKAEAEQSRQEVAALREQGRLSAINAEVKLVGMREGANDAADLLAFVARESLEIGEDGTVKGVEEAIKSLKERKPYLFKPQQSEPEKPAGQHPPNNASPKRGAGDPFDPAARMVEKARQNAQARGMNVPV
jgi:hypothetical protein